MATPTSINRDVAPKPLNVDISVIFSIILGMTAMNAKNNLFRKVKQLVA